MDYRDEVYFHSRPENEAPFPPEEYKARLVNLRARMAKAGIDTLYLMAPESLNYLSGYQALWLQAQSPRQWPAASAIAVHVDHDDYIFFDSEREAILGRIFTHSTDTRFFPKNALRGSIGFVADELAAAGWLSGTVGFEMRSYRPNAVIAKQIQDAFSEKGATIVDGTDLLREQRWIKSPLEIESLKQAARIANIGIAAARDNIRAGRTELEIYGEIIRAMAAAGGENPSMTISVLSGAKTNALHGMATRRVIKPGELVQVDLCGVYNRYHIDIARTFSVGDPDPEAAAIADRGAAVMVELRAMLKPDLPIRAFNETAERLLKDADLWDRRGWIGGYEMGISLPPDWVGHVMFEPGMETNADRTFEVGTAVNYEHQFFLPRHQGQCFTIDSFLFESSGARGLSEHPFGLVAVG